MPSPSCSHVQLPLHREVRAARGDPSLLGFGRELRVSVRAFEDECVLCVERVVSDLIVTSLCSEWYLNGNYLVVFVSIGIILPLSLLKNLGEDSTFFFFPPCALKSCHSNTSDVAADSLKGVTRVTSCGLEPVLCRRFRFHALTAVSK